MSMTDRSDDGLVSYSTAAAMLGIPRQTIAWLVEQNRHAITPKPMSSNCNGKGLDTDAVEFLRRAWRRARVPASARR